MVRDIGRSVRSTALHPNTVYDREWTPPGLTIVFEGRGTEDEPLCLETDLGVDVFYRQCPLPRPVWYRSPIHSGAKRIGTVLGKRYCSACRMDVSSNNFVLQHMRMHPPECHTDEWSLFCEYINV